MEIIRVSPSQACYSTFYRCPVFRRAVFTATRLWYRDGFTTIYCLCDRRVANRCFTINILTEFLNSANYRFYKAHEKEGCSKKFHAESFLSYKVVGLQLWWKILHRQFFANNFVKLCKTAIGKLVLRLMPNND